MRYIVSFLLVFCSMFANGQTSFTITKIPYSNAEIRDYGRGGEDWQYREEQLLTIPDQNGVAQQPKNLYVRYKWFNLESAQGVYDFSRIEGDIRYCIDRKMKLGIGIMHQYVGDEQGGYPTAGGAGMTYPLYLHDLMQALPVNERDWVTSTNWWTPNYNASIYLDRFDSLHANLYRWLNTTSYQGVKYKDVIQYVDVRGYGNWGEWNQVGVLDDAANGWPTGRKASYETLRRIIQSYTTYFPDLHLAIMIAAFDCERLGNVWNPPAIARYAIDTAANLKGKIGWRRDNFGSLDGYVDFWLKDNTATSIRDTAINYFIMNRWKTTPIINEHTSAGFEAVLNGVPYGTLESQVIEYNVASFGIGNAYALPLSSATIAAFRAASKRAGHRLVLNSGSMTTTVASNSTFNVTVVWGNDGVSPTYDAWKVRYQLRNTSNGTVAWTGNSAVNLREVRPGTPVTMNETFTATNVPAGTYRLHMIVEDSVNYMNPMHVMINGRQSDGSYILRTDISVTSTGNMPPSANAGADRIIVLPTNTVALTGSGTDYDGTITSYLWTKVSGPSGGTISSPTSATTNITGLNQGTYVYRLRVTDNQGATATDDVSIIVNPAPQPEPVGNWIFTTTPDAVEDAGAAVVLGTKFRAIQSGAITKLRFWKTANNTGTHTWAIYSESGTRLDSGRFETETAVGWQYDDVDTLFISANTTYVVAYYSPTGYYSKTEGGLNNTITNNILSAPSTFTVGGNGVYIYNAGIAFPNLTYNGNNYWVDVMYENIQPQVTPNVGPVVNAGFDAVVTAPNTQYQLSGTAVDSDGTIDSTHWSLVSASTITGNPVTVTISDTTVINPVIGGLSEPGTYTFLFQAWDDDGASSTDLIVVTVRTAATNYLRKRVYIFNGKSIKFR